MDRVNQLVRQYYPHSGAELQVGRVPVSRLTAEYGTPVFVYSREVLDDKFRRLRATLPEEFEICYSVKANPNLAILQHFLSLGCGLEIASAGEFSQALAAGCPPGRIVFAGPGKTESELKLVLSKGIGEIHAESVLELRRISRITQRLGCRAPVAIRVNPTGEVSGGAMRMGGKPAPFGVDEENLDEVLDYAAGEDAIEFCGIHLFTGTQILDCSVLLAQYRKGLEIARRAARRCRCALRTVDFGGGLGIPYFAHEAELDTKALGEGLAALMAEIRNDGVFSGTRLLVEPGRYLVGEAGVYVARVTDVKVSRGKKFLIIDGGMNHHLAASGNLGQTIKRNFPVAVLNRLQEPATETVDVVGPLCTPLDVLARGVSLPAAEVGDLVGVFQSGAYARAASPLGFLSHPTPPEVWVDGEHHCLVRLRGEARDYIRDVRLPTHENVEQGS